ncbi:glycosyltransferase [uncultured Williamsia sp.]|uniref:glycosyltransferase n=1 Tax=uncultured Williamsia sp. TaxID=259311 RepID=UPI00260EDC9E|nr:glycosyltransferase [uncultured Williamsia sp.]
MTTPLVSVVTISLDDIRGLRHTIAGVSAQDHEAVEHIVIDGGSGPEVRAMLEATPNMAYWQSQRDGGRYDAMNIGLAHATGSIIWFMHSGDTFASPQSISTAIGAVGAPSAGWWAHGMARLVDRAGRSRGLMGQKEFNLARFAAGGVAIPHQATFFHRALFDEIGVHDLSVGLAADQEFMLRAALRRPPIVIDEILCDFDISGAGSTRGVHPHFVDMRRAARAHIEMSASARLAHLARSYIVEARSHMAYARLRMRVRTR